MGPEDDDDPRIAEAEDDDYDDRIHGDEADRAADREEYAREGRDRW